MNDVFKKQVYNSLNLKETDELIEIWQNNDRLEWSDTAFEVIGEILQQRLDKVPGQGQPIYEHIEKVPPHTFDDLLEEEDSPNFYKPREVLWLYKWINRAAIASVILSIIVSFYQWPTTRTILWSYNMSDEVWKITTWFISGLMVVLATALQCIFVYFPLKALASMLKILMEMEHESRGAS